MGKLRLVLNLRYLNQFVHAVKFKYEDLRIAAMVFESNEYLFKFDLKSGYHHLDIHPAQGNTWVSSGGERVAPAIMSSQSYMYLLGYAQFHMYLQS